MGSSQTRNNIPIDGNREPSRRVPPLFNDMFLYLFGREESKPLTRSLLNAVLRAAGLPEIGEIDQISADAARPGGIECRTARCDVIVVSGGGVYDIESHGWHADVANKSLFYAAHLIRTKTPRGASGDSYKDMPQVVIVTLLHGQKLFPDDEQYLTMGDISWRIGGRCERATDRLLYIVVEMDKIAERYNLASGEVLSDESLAWLYLLAKGYSEPREVEEMASEFREILNFAREYGIAIDDPDLERQYRVYESSILEYNAMMNEARDKGLAQGREEGLEQGREEGLEQGRAEGREEGRAEGRAEGREEGLEQGREEGREEGRAEVAERLRAMGFDERMVEQALGKAPL